jgi:hypothetical protein
MVFHLSNTHGWSSGLSNLKRRSLVGWASPAKGRATTPTTPPFIYTPLMTKSLSPPREHMAFAIDLSLSNRVIWR